MTDELTIQGVNPQMQQVQKKNNTVPYTLGGAAVGATAGYFINNAVQSKANWEDLVKEVKDTTDFSTKAEPATWNSLKEKANEVAKLQEQLKNLPEKTLTSGKEFDDLEAAKKARNAEFERLVKIESAKGEQISSKFPSQKILNKELSVDENRMFAPYYRRYENAKRNLLGTPGTGLRGGKARLAFETINTKRNNVNTMYNDLFTEYNALSDKAKENFDPLKKGSKVANKINTAVDTVLPERPHKGLTYAQAKEYQNMFGDGIFEILDKNPGSAKGKTIQTVKDASGKKFYVLIDKDSLSSKREALKAEYAENLRKFIDNKKEIDGFTKKFFEANESAIKSNDLLASIKKPSDWESLVASKGGRIKDVRDALSSIELMEVAIDKKVEKFPLDFGALGKVKNVDELQTLKGKVQNMKELLESYHKELGQLKAQQKKIINSDVRVENAKNQFKKLIEDDKGIKSVLDSIENDLNGKFATKEQKALYAKIKSLIGTEGSNASTADIEAKVRDMMKGGEFENKLKLAQDAFDEAVKTKGTANTAAKEAIEGQIKTASEALEKGAKELAGKLKTGGMNKYAAMAIGGVALALAGFGIASSKKA